MARTMAPVFSPILSSAIVWSAKGDSFGTANCELLADLAAHAAVAADDPVAPQLADLDPHPPAPEVVPNRALSTARATREVMA